MAFLFYKFKTKKKPPLKFLNVYFIIFFFTYRSCIEQEVYNEGKTYNIIRR